MQKEIQQRTETIRNSRCSRFEMQNSCAAFENLRHCHTLLPSPSLPLSPSSLVKDIKNVELRAYATYAKKK